MHDSSPGENVRAEGDGDRPPETRDENWTGHRGRGERDAATGRRVSGRAELPGVAPNVAHVAAAKPVGAVGQPFVDGV